MSIEIIRSAPLRVTASEYHRLRHKFDMDHMFYFGPLPDFEEWARSQIDAGRANTTGDGA